MYTSLIRTNRKAKKLNSSRKELLKSLTKAAKNNSVRVRSHSSGIMRASGINTLSPKSYFIKMTV